MGQVVAAKQALAAAAGGRLPAAGAAVPLTAFVVTCAGEGAGDAEGLASRR